jgi:HEAT repeat protein
MVVLHLVDGQIRKVKTTVGPEWPAARTGTADLGLVPAVDAAKALVALAEEGTSAADAIFPATLADSAEIWPDLLVLARRKDAPEESRKQAIFWLGQAAGDRATAGLTELADAADDDKEIRESAVFALSQLSDGGGVPALIKLARSSKHGDVRRNALFWLGQSEDPRALDLFEELLTRR